VWSAELIRGEIFELDSEPSRKLFDVQIQVQNENELEKRNSEFRTPGGDLVLREFAEVQGARFLKTRIEQLQTGENVVIRRLSDRELEFEVTDAKGKVDRKSDKFKRTLVMSSSFQNFIRENWEAIKKGEKIEFDLGVWQRRQVLGFRLQRTGGSDQRHEIQMEIDNRLLRFLLPTAIEFVMDGSGKILSQKGRVQPMVQKNGAWKDLDAHLIFQ
ncbi:MAG: hypothetical protein WCH11_06245, partial [Bdellovibrio sp.]